MLDIVFEEVTVRNMRLAQNHDFADIVCLGYALDVGDIDCEIDSPGRREVFTRFQRVDRCMGDAQEFFARQRVGLTRLLDAAEAGERLRVWRSSEPHNACGFAFLCDALREIDCELCSITLPETLSHWGFLEGHCYAGFLYLKKPIDAAEKQRYSDLWRSLKRENAPLRALINGRLLSVPEDFYDFVILRHMPQEPVVLGDFLGKVLGEWNDLGLPVDWFSMRIERMIEENKLEIVDCNDSVDPFRRVVRLRSSGAVAVDFIKGNGI